MKFISILFALPALLATAIALPAETDANAPSKPPSSSSSDYKWHVTKWSAGCARSGCYYDFRVRGEAQKISKSSQGGAKPPAFLAYCSGEQDWFRECSMLQSGCDGKRTQGCAVSARLFPDPKDPTNATIGISFAWTQELDRNNYPRYNYTGFNQTIFNQFAAPEQQFFVTPTQITAVL